MPGRGLNEKVLCNIEVGVCANTNVTDLGNAKTFRGTYVMWNKYLSLERVIRKTEFGA